MALFGGWFGSSSRGVVDREGETALVATWSDGGRSVIDVAALAWVGFLYVGDEFSPVHEGWWRTP